MYKVTSVTINIPLVLCTDQKYDTWIVYLNPQQIEQEKWEWWAQDFTRLPTIHELRNIVDNYANEEIERKFREEFIWTSFDGETFNVDLTPLKEQELKSLYNNLPFNYILGKNYEGHAFESSEELDDFFNKLEEFKQSCQQEIYAMVNAIDWNLYEQALEEAKE